MMFGQHTTLTHGVVKYVCALDFRQLEKRVNELLEGGYELYGGLVVVGHATAILQFVQMMVYKPVSNN
jgi:hypothetical protein